LSKVAIGWLPQAGNLGGVPSVEFVRRSGALREWVHLRLQSQETRQKLAIDLGCG
jgi:hypothetical protein